MRRISETGYLRAAIICLVAAAITGAMAVYLKPTAADPEAGLARTTLLAFGVPAAGLLIGGAVCLAIHACKVRRRRWLVRHGVMVRARVVQAWTRTGKPHHSGETYTYSVHAVLRHDGLSWEVRDIVGCNATDILGKYFPVWVGPGNPRKSLYKNLGRRHDGVVKKVTGYAA